jgi:hypothetical protein
LLPSPAVAEPARSRIAELPRQGQDGAMTNTRVQITMETALQRRAQARAKELGISLAEYVRRLIASDLGEPKPKPKPKADISIVFDLIGEGSPTDIARDKEKMIGEALWEDYLRKTRRKPLPRPRAR